MSSYSSALMWMALAAQVVAWPATRLHETSGSLMRLPAAERAVAEHLLRSQLGPLFQGEDSGQVEKAIHSFRAERFTLAGTPAVAVQPSGGDLCGATGNCSFWIIDLHQRRIVLRADGVQQFAVEHSSKRGFPDVITSTQESTESELIQWQFAGASYTPAACATRDFSDADGHPLPEPKTTPHPCAPEGN